MTSDHFAEAHKAADFFDSHISASHGVTLREIERQALQRGREIDAAGEAVSFEDRAPGVRFVVNYRLDQPAETITFSTAVYYEKPLGKWYFTVVKPFHRRLAPLVPKATVRRALRARPAT